MKIDHPLATIPSHDLETSPANAEKGASEKKDNTAEKASTKEQGKQEHPAASAAPDLARASADGIDHAARIRHQAEQAKPEKTSSSETPAQPTSNTTQAPKAEPTSAAEKQETNKDAADLASQNKSPHDKPAKEGETDLNTASPKKESPKDEAVNNEADQARGHAYGHDKKDAKDMSSFMQYQFLQNTVASFSAQNAATSATSALDLGAADQAAGIAQIAAAQAQQAATQAWQTSLSVAPKYQPAAMQQAIAADKAADTASNAAARAEDAVRESKTRTYQAKLQKVMERSKDFFKSKWQQQMREK